VTRAEQVTDPLFSLAEGPVWDAVRERLLWVDILEGRVHTGRLGTGSVEIGETHQFDSYVGAVAVDADGGLLVADFHRLTRVAPGGSRSPGADLFADHPDDRWNDGVRDARGRFLIGTASLTGLRHSQRLLRIDGETVTVLDDDLGLANGMAFSPDDSVLYSIDSLPGRRIWARDYDHDSGATGPRRPLFDIADAVPDGLCVDAAGHLWLAAWGRGEVRCYSTSGDLLDVIGLPAPHTTSLAFVGPDLDQLLVTTANGELSPDQREEFPLSGSLFLARPGCIGLVS
jgi:sugar lactone lactonase YvrE